MTSRIWEPAITRRLTEGGREGGVWGRSQGIQGERKGNQSSPTGYNYKGEIKEN